MNLFSLFVSRIRAATAEAVRQGICDGMRAVLGDQAMDTAGADTSEAEVRLLLLPAPVPEPAKSARRRAE